MSRGLGRGLGALIPAKPVVQAAPAAVTTEAQAAMVKEPGIFELALEKIQPNPDQPRKYFDPGALEDLAASIKEHGILQPLVVTPAGKDGKHSLIAGERRYRAAQIVGLKKVPVVVRDVKEQEQLALAIVENIQRSDLNPVEEAKGYIRLMNEFNLTQEEVAKRVGKSRSGIANTLRLLELPEEVQKAVAEGKISMGHAKVLASLENGAAQEEYAKRILSEKLSVRELEQATRQVRSKRNAAPSASFDPVRDAQEEMLRERFATKVQIKKTGQKGQVVLHFYSLEELQRLLSELT